MRVLIGASSEVVRAGLESLLATAPTFQVVGSFPIGTALARFEDLQPDVVLLDLESLADESMSPAIESGGMVRNSALVILTDDPGNFLVADALRSGVRAILPREATSEEIVAAIQASVAGLVVLHPDALDSVLSPTSLREPTRTRSFGSDSYPTRDRSAAHDSRGTGKQGDRIQAENFGPYR